MLNLKTTSGTIVLNEIEESINAYKLEKRIFTKKSSVMDALEKFVIRRKKTYSNTNRSMSSASQLELLQLLFGQSSEKQDKPTWKALVSLRNQIIGFNLFHEEFFEEKGMFWRIQKITDKLSSHQILTQELMHSIGQVCDAFIKRKVKLNDILSLIEQLVNLNKHLLQPDILSKFSTKRCINLLPLMLSVIESRNARKWFSNEDGYNNFLALLNLNDLKNALLILEILSEESANAEYFDDFQIIRDQLLNPEWKARKILEINLEIFRQLFRRSTIYKKAQLRGIPSKLFISSLITGGLTTEEEFNKLKALIQTRIIPQSSYSKTIDSINSLLRHAHIFTHDSVFYALEAGDYYPDLSHVTSTLVSPSAITESMFLQQLRAAKPLLEEAIEKAESDCEKLLGQLESRTARRSVRFSR